MQHVYGVIGASLGLIGTAALSFDLLKSKSVEGSLKEFRHLQDQVDASSQELTVRTTEGIKTIGDFLANYLRILEAEALLAVEKATGTKPPASDAKIDALRNFISQHSQLDVRQYALSLFLVAEEKLSSRLDVDKALGLVAQARQVLERRFTEEAVHAQRLRRVAIAGVALVGLGAVGQLIDLLVA